MDRRQALRQLGVGTALVVSSPALLPAFRVSAAASGPGDPTGLIGVPGDGAVIPFTQPPPRGGGRSTRQVVLGFDTGTVTCEDGSQPIVTAQWRIASLNLGSRQHTQRMVINDLAGSGPGSGGYYPTGAELATTPFVVGSHLGGAYGAESYSQNFVVGLRRLQGGGREKDVPVDPNTSYIIEVRVRWHCDGASQDVVAEYQFSGSGTATPNVAFLSWTDEAQP